MYTIPTLCNKFLPCSYFLSLLEVISEEKLTTLCKRTIELSIVVVKLTLHCIVRSNLCD